MTRQANEFLRDYPLVGKGIISILILVVGWFAVRSLDKIDDSVASVALELKGVRAQIADQQVFNTSTEYRLKACEKAVVDCDK